MSVLAPTPAPLAPELGEFDRALRLLSILAAVGVPIVGDGGLHLILAAVAVILGCLFLVRTRRRRTNGKLLVRLAVVASLLWLIGVTAFAFWYSWNMRNFN